MLVMYYLLTLGFGLGIIIIIKTHPFVPSRTRRTECLLFKEEKKDAEKIWSSFQTCFPQSELHR